MMKRLVLSADHPLIDPGQVPLIRKLEEARDILGCVPKKRRSRSHVKMRIIILEECVEGGDPGGLAPGFFSSPYIVMFEKGGVMWVHLQLFGAEAPPISSAPVVPQAALLK